MRKDYIVLYCIDSIHTGMGLIAYTTSAPKICEQIPTEIRHCKMLNMFKVKIKTWIPAKCPCRLCKVYVSNVVYIDQSSHFSLYFCLLTLFL